MSNRFRSAAVIAAGCVALAGCGGDEGGGSGGGGDKAKDIDIAFITAASSLNFAQEMTAGAEAAAKEEGVDLKTYAPPQVDGPAQVKLFQDAARSAKDGIAIETLTPPLLVRPQAQAARDDIPVISVDTPPLPGSEVKTYVGNDNAEAARLLADEAVRRAKASNRTSGTAVVGNPAPGVPTLDNRADALAEELKAQLPDYDVKGPFDTKTPPTENFNAWSNLFGANRDATIFVDAGDSANASLAKLNRGGDKLTGAFDLNPAGLQAVKSDVNFAIADPQHFLKGYVAVKLLVDRAKNGTEIPEGWWKSPAELITKENVDEIIARQESPQSKLDFYKPILDKQFADPDAQMQPLQGQ